MENQSQYDSIALIYATAEALPFRPYVELYTDLKLMGDIEGKVILDVACGDGLYSRLFRQRGAAKVVGMDISAGMIEVARSIEEKTKLGIEYLVHDAAEMPVLGSFDLVTAMYLLHYAQTEEIMLRMCRNMYANLRPGGRLVTVAANPDFNIRGPNLTKYGITMHMKEPARGGDKCTADVLVNPPFVLEFYHWSRETHEWALREAGFRNITWPRHECSPDGIAKYGRAFWDDYLTNPHAVPIVCERY